ncbi:MAG: patatin-like phospholipase family protein, partial [Dehalococcoidia bacterium]|nr:patatin-like phospholipase family protein [Dehalococcoidia bacterium]
MAVLFGLFGSAEKLEESYREYLVGDFTLGELPDKPNFVFNAAHIETGRNCTLSKAGLHTWRLGDIPIPDISLAKAVAASSACPPYFPAVILDLNPKDFVKGEEYVDLFHRDDLKRQMSLTDGGVYDNLGVHAVRDCDTILVSDGSAPLQAKHSTGLTKQFQHRVLRPMEIAVEQTRAIRRNQLVEAYQSHAKEGCLWYAGQRQLFWPLCANYSGRSG